MNAEHSSCRWDKFLAGACLGLVALAGCGGGDHPQPADPAQASPGATDESASPRSTAGGRLPTASIGGAGRPGSEGTKLADLEEGSPEWLVRKILLLRFQPYPQTDDPELLRVARRKRNEQIIELATEAIRKSHSRPEKEEAFDAAAHQLVEARVALAQQGRQEDITDLYDLAELFYQRDAGSKAAAEAAYRVALFANASAIRYPQPEAGWLEEFVRRARLFAKNFPHEEARAVRLLDAAGRSCEFHRRVDQAVGCYLHLEQQFPDSVQAQHATAVLRRLRLKGQPLVLAGPTLDGGFVRIGDYRGRVVLVVFWAADRNECHAALEKLAAVARKYKQDGFAVIGVNLDEEEPAVREFLKRTPLDWPQIFSPDPARRRWENEVARHYAIRDIPTIWLVDRKGIVVDSRVDPDKLDSQVQELLRGWQ